MEQEQEIKNKPGLHVIEIAFQQIDNRKKAAHCVDNVNAMKADAIGRVEKDKQAELAKLDGAKPRKPK